MAGYEKVVIVTRKTALDELVERYNTRDQARFYVARMARVRAGATAEPGATHPTRRSRPVPGDFTEYEQAHEVYRRSQEIVSAALPAGTRSQFVERSFLPNFVFGAED